MIADSSAAARAKETSCASSTAGPASTRSLDSRKPRPRTDLTALMTAIFFSSEWEWRNRLVRASEPAKETTAKGSLATMAASSARACVPERFSARTAGRGASTLALATGWDRPRASLKARITRSFCTNDWRNTLIQRTSGSTAERETTAAESAARTASVSALARSLGTSSAMGHGWAAAIAFLATRRGTPSTLQIAAMTGRFRAKECRNTVHGRPDEGTRATGRQRNPAASSASDNSVPVPASSVTTSTANLFRTGRSCSSGSSTATSILSSASAKTLAWEGVIP